MDKETTETVAMGYQAHELYKRAYKTREHNKCMYFQHFTSYLCR